MYMCMHTYAYVWGSLAAYVVDGRINCQGRDRYRHARNHGASWFQLGQETNMLSSITCNSFALKEPLVEIA